ncbi:hypothetical protein PM082_006306 [Marasmius tenuissimus]|nr:hypothetical protein PM082_006306 [Marasmius tenuissimus]
MLAHYTPTRQTNGYTPALSNERVYPDSAIGAGIPPTLLNVRALWPAARLGILSPVLTPNDFIYLFEIWEGLEQIFKIGRSNNPPRRCQCIRR